MARDRFDEEIIEPSQPVSDYTTKINSMVEYLRIFDTDVLGHEEASNPHEVTTEQVNQKENNWKDNDALPNEYEQGITIFQSDSTNNNFPEDFSVITTYRLPGSSADPDVAVQECINHTGTTNTFRKHTRVSKAKENGWTDWTIAETRDGAQSKADSAEYQANQYTDGRVDPLRGEFDNHIEDDDNPHNVTSAQLNVLSPNLYSAGVSGNSYPEGLSVFQTSDSGSGFPEQYGTVFTMRLGSIVRIVQHFYSSTGNTRTDTWVRHWDQSNSRWTSFEKMVSANNIRSGTSSPSDSNGDDGDIYVQY